MYIIARSSPLIFKISFVNSRSIIVNVNQAIADNFVRDARPATTEIRHDPAASVYHANVTTT